jgi:Zn-dependent M28 family amino/carboxypeptidase
VFREAGLQVVKQEIPGGVANVIGIVPGGDRAVLVSAHYDHLGVDEDGVVYPGADDNASGVAVMLAMARAASAAPLEDTVLFIAFGAEEPGLIGSGAYVQKPIWPLDRTAAVINFDMVGRNFFEAAADKEATAAVVGLEGHPAVRAAAERAAAAAGLTLVSTPAKALEVFGFDDRTDDWWFRRRGVFAVHFSTSMHYDYHQPSDTVDKLVPAQMRRVARTAYGLLVYLAGGPRRGGAE